MPYIRKEVRKEIDNIEVYKLFINMPLEQFVGNLSYLIYKIIKMWLTRHEKRYYTLCAILGALSSVKVEIERRILSPYELSRKVENGDI